MWSAPDPLLQYGVILGYTLTCSELNSNVVPDVFPVTLPHPPSNTEVNELKPFTEYQCSLVAYNSAGDSPASSDTAMTEQDGKILSALVNYIWPSLRKGTYQWNNFDKNIYYNL